MMIIWCILLTPLFNYITLKAGSVIAPSILHGTLTTSAGIPIMVIAGGNDLINGMTGIAGMITLLILILLLIFYDTGIAKENITRNTMEKFY